MMGCRFTNEIRATPSCPQVPLRAVPAQWRVIDWVASPDLGGGQLPVLRLHVASARPRNEGIILLRDASVYAPRYKARQSTKEAPSFLELRKAEVRLLRILLPHTRVNRGKDKDQGMKP